MTHAMAERVAAIKHWANEYYNDHGWDYVVEAMDDEDIERYLSETFFDGSPVPATPEQDRARIGEICRLWDDRRRDIQATRW